jgi:hypothetical protein
MQAFTQKQRSILFKKYFNEWHGNRSYESQSEKLFHFFVKDQYRLSLLDKEIGDISATNSNVKATKVSMHEIIPALAAKHSLPFPNKMWIFWEKIDKLWESNLLTPDHLHGMRKILSQNGFTSSEILVFESLLHCGKGWDWVRVSQKYLSENNGLTIRTVKRALSRMMEKGVKIVEVGGYLKNSTEYDLSGFLDFLYKASERFFMKKWGEAGVGVDSTKEITDV